MAMHFLQINYLFHRIIEKMRQCAQTTPLKRKPRAVSSFLKKTYELLNDEQNLDIVKWASNGVGFIVLDQDGFARQVLPRYFKHSNYSSFVRQLNMYNFHKIRESNGQSSFHHQHFDRCNEAKLAEIRRKPEKKKRRGEESDEEEASDHLHESRPILKEITVKKMKEELKEIRSLPKTEFEPSEVKIEEDKNTRHFFSEECNGEQPKKEKERVLQAGQVEEDKISINNEIEERVLPRLATRELFYPSNNNLFPFWNGQAQTSTFCLFF